MRQVKIPYHGDEGDFDTARVHRAEQKFLESLRREAARKPTQTRGRVRAAKTPQRLGKASMAAGRGLGAAYARLNGNMDRARDLDRIASFAGAIKAGVNEAQRRDAREAELLNSSEHLESMGFRGFGPQRDDF